MFAAKALLDKKAFLYFTLLITLLSPKLVISQCTTTANFSSTAPACSGDSVNFISTSSSDTIINSFSWTFGAGATPATSILENPTGIVYSTGGLKSVTLTIVDSCGGIYLKTNGILINESPTAIFSVAPNDTLCMGIPVSYTNTGSTGGSWTYSWDFGSSATPPTSTAENPGGIQYSTPGLKIITFTITDGTCSDTQTDTVIINNTPTAAFASTAPKCNADSVSFTNTGTALAAYSWAFGAGSSPASAVTEGPHQVMYSTAGTKSITLITTLGTCADTSVQTITINETPTVSFSSTAPVCAGEKVDFTNTGSSGVMWSYSWDFGSDAAPATSTAENPVGVNYSLGGTKTVTLSIADGSCAANDTQTITVNITPVADFTSNAPRCNAEPVLFTNTGTTGGGATYSWAFGVASSPPTAFTAGPHSVLYSNAGTKSVTQIITQGTCADTTVKTITVNETPTISFTTTAPVCAGAKVDFTNTGTTGIKWSYSWDFGEKASPSTSSNENPTGVIYSAGKTKVITLSITDGICINTDTMNIAIDTLPFVDAGLDTIICANRSVQIGTPALAGYTYTWIPESLVDDNNIAQPTASPTASITLYVLTVTDIASSCNSLDTIIISMLTSAIVNAGDDAEICVGDSVQIGTGFLEGQTYIWSPATGLSDSSISNPIARPSVTTLYSMSANYATCDSITDDVLVIVNPPPTVNAGEDVTIVFGSSTTLSASGGIMYEWSPVTDLSNPRLYNPIANPDSTITYSVFVIDLNGCSNTDSVEVKVIGEDFFVPNAFTPDGNGFNDVFRIRGTELSDFELRVFNRWGELIFITNIFNAGWDGTKSDTGEDYPAGAYVYHIKGFSESQNTEVSYSGVINLIR